MVKEDNSSNIKKKRKLANPKTESESDIYKKVVEFEEKESFNRQGSVDAELYFDLCTDIRNLLTEVFNLKQSDPNSKKLKDIQTEIFIKMCLIKKLNRIDKIRHVYGKETLSTEKQKCDSIKLNYQNLVYELHHLVTETNKCLAFKSKDEDIELVPFEEFMKEAPEDVSKKFSNYDENDRDQKHSLRLARLEWELMQRKNLAQLCKSLIEEQKKLEQDLVERKEKLNALRPLLMNIIDSTKPLQEHLDMSLKEMRVDHKLAYLLPDPLYIFYVNVVSYKSVNGLDLTVEIVGEEDEAVQWKECGKNGNFLEEESDEQEQEVEEIVEVKKRRHRKSMQVDPMEEKKKKLLEQHPLKVRIQANLPDGFSLVVFYSYQTRLKIITVASETVLPSNVTGNCAKDVLNGENLLSELIEGDTGLESPNPITKFQIKKVGFASFRSLVPQIGYAYNWAQKVCGMDFLNKKMNSDEVGGTNIEKVLKILFERLESRRALAEQLQLLEQNLLPKLPDCIDYHVNFVCSLTKWCPVTYQKYCQSEFTKMLVEDELVAPSDAFYALNITRGNAVLEALIVIKNNYPQDVPMFSLCIKYNGVYHSDNDDEIRDMERLLNVDIGDKSSSLLSIQIARLQSYFDVYLETTDSKVFPQTVTFIRNVSGRNRKKPLKYCNAGNGIFTQ
ncbi:unnamed protein product [Phyllotreta striolata]|uniref:THO complex subunit 5 n=1 Tax=Phyllotreta striolata TaxID=444603 RepID=A0A9N9TWS4_PHYSR|nr:unnamed protein product [Phyllotreta striolata]